MQGKEDGNSRGKGEAKAGKGRSMTEEWETEVVPCVFVVLVVKGMIMRVRWEFVGDWLRQRKKER